MWSCPQITTAIAELDNIVLRVHPLIMHTDVNAMVDDEALSDICRSNSDVERTHRCELLAGADHLLIAGCTVMSKSSRHLVLYPCIHCKLGSEGLP